MSGCPDWSSSNKCTRFRESSLGARISSKIIADIRLGHQLRINYNCCNKPFADLKFTKMFLDMHGLIFYLSISPLAGSTRYLQRTEARSCLDCITQRESRTEETRHRRTEKVKRSLAYTSKGHQFDIEFANHPRLNSSGSSDIPFQNFTKYVLQLSRSSIA